jgi:hypothetical protein
VDMLGISLWMGCGNVVDSVNALEVVHSLSTGYAQGCSQVEGGVPRLGGPLVLCCGRGWVSVVGGVVWCLVLFAVAWFM